MSYNKKMFRQMVEESKQKKTQPKPKDRIVDPMGQWAHPGQVTRIPSNRITMQGVPYPVLGRGSDGSERMMYPGEEHTFPDAEYVDEYPLTKAQNGIQMLDLPDVHLNLPKYSRQEDKKVGVNPYMFGFNPQRGVNIHGIGAQGYVNLFNSKKNKLGLTGNVNSVSVGYPGGVELFGKPQFFPELRFTHRFENGGQEEPTPLELAKIKAKMALESHFGNPSARRMTTPYPQDLVFKIDAGPDKGKMGRGTHWMYNEGNYAVPIIQEGRNGKLFFNKNASPSDREAMRFDSPEDAASFAKYYKYVAPMSRNSFENGGPIVVPYSKEYTDKEYQDYNKFYEDYFRTPYLRHDDRFDKYYHEKIKNLPGMPIYSSGWERKNIADGYVQHYDRQPKPKAGFVDRKMDNELIGYDPNDKYPSQTAGPYKMIRAFANYQPSNSSNILGLKNGGFATTVQTTTPLGSTEPIVDVDPIRYENREGIGEVGILPNIVIAPHLNDQGKRFYEKILDRPSKPVERYEPSNAVKYNKGALSAAALSTMAAPEIQYLIQLAGATGDFYTGTRYALDKNWSKAGEDYTQGLLGLIPYSKALKGMKGDEYYTLLQKLYNATIGGLKFGSDVKTMDEGVDKKQYGGDISIPNLEESNWLDRYDDGGFVTTSETTFPLLTREEHEALYNSQIALNKFYENEVRQGRLKRTSTKTFNQPSISNREYNRLKEGNLTFYKHPPGTFYDTLYKKIYNLSPSQIRDLERKSLEQIQKSNSNNQLYYRDIVTPAQNLVSPFALVDKRVKPQRVIRYEPVSGNLSGYPGGNVELFDYDPLYIKPPHLRSKKENLEWEKLYGDKPENKVIPPSVSSLLPQLKMVRNTIGIEPLSVGTPSINRQPSIQPNQSGDYVLRFSELNSEGQNQPREVFFKTRKEADDMMDFLQKENQRRYETGTYYGNLTTQGNYKRGGQLKQFQPGGAFKKCPNGQYLLRNGQCGTFDDLQREAAVTGLNRALASNQMVWQGNAPKTQVIVPASRNAASVARGDNTSIQRKPVLNPRTGKKEAASKSDATFSQQWSQPLAREVDPEFVERENIAMGLTAAPFLAPIIGSGLAAAGFTPSAVGAALNAPMLGTAGLTGNNLLWGTGAYLSGSELINPNSATRTSINQAIKNPTFNNVAGAIGTTGLTGLGFAGLPIRSGLLSLGDDFTRAGQYLTTQTPLKNTYKINPWAFKPDSKAAYRMLGTEGFDDAMEIGYLRAKPSAGKWNPLTGKIEYGTPNYEHPYFSVGKPWDKDLVLGKPYMGYKGPYMAELKNQKLIENDLGYSTGRNNIFRPEEKILTNNPDLKFYKEDWLRGYKEVPKPTSTISSNITSSTNTAKPFVFNQERFNESKGFLDRYQHLKQLQSQGLIAKDADILKYARSGEGVNDITKRAIERANTRYRGVYPDLRAYDRTGQSYNLGIQLDEYNINKIMTDIQNAGVDINDPVAIGEYMATHIPSETIGYRSGAGGLPEGWDAIFTTTGPIREYGSHKYEIKLPFDFSKGSYKDWLTQFNKPKKSYNEIATQRFPSSMNWKERQNVINSQIFPGMPNVPRKISTDFIGPRGFKVFESPRLLSTDEVIKLEGKGLPLPKKLGGQTNWLDKYN